MHPPIPGPVFSPAFNALLVLMFFGCTFLCFNLKTSLDAARASDIGEDNQTMKVDAAWLKQVRDSGGMVAAKRSKEIRGAVDEEMGVRKKKSTKGKDGGGGDRASRKPRPRDSELEMCECEDVPLRAKVMTSW